MTGSDELKSLQERIDHAKAEAGMNVSESENAAERNSRSKAMDMATQFIAAAGVGCALGYFIDRWLNSSPIGLIGGFFLGFAAGVYNLVRAEKKDGSI